MTVKKNILKIQFLQNLGPLYNIEICKNILFVEI